MLGNIEVVFVICFCFYDVVVEGLFVGLELFMVELCGCGFVDCVGVVGCLVVVGICLLFDLVFC